MWGKVQQSVENSKKLFWSSEGSNIFIFDEIKKITITDTSELSISVSKIILNQSLNLISNVSRRIFTQFGRKGAPSSSF